MCQRHLTIHSSTRAKPFTCEIDGCKAAFGDPSSRARHCKEKHRTIGAYRCPIDHCKSSIKRRSAFVKHLKKHNINPDNIDMEALAPIMISRLAPYQKQSSKAAPTGGSHHSTPLKPDFPDLLCPDVAFYQKGSFLAFSWPFMSIHGFAQEMAWLSPFHVFRTCMARRIPSIATGLSLQLSPLPPGFSYLKSRTQPLCFSLSPAISPLPIPHPIP
ncbi:hypothetical protein H0H93_000018 [Arthromyces matolae]|nr:hypothetical protein H0H93_000018 [Arthromyces matolae]